jgi:hypothetical protein
VSIDQSDVIDFVAVDEDGTVVLVMVEGREWEGSDVRLRELQTKVNTYASFALDGELGAHDPELQGKAVRFELRCVSEPDARTGDFLGQIERRLTFESIPFRVKLIGPDPS